MKKAFVLSLLVAALSIGAAANAIGHKNNSVPKGQKPSRAESILNETLDNSMVKEEYKSGERVTSPDGEEIKVNNEAKYIEGSVEKNLDLDLGDCLKLALGNNPKIRSALNSALASHARIGEAWAEYFPKLQWQTGIAREKGLKENSEAENNAYTSYLMGDIGVSQLLYDFGVTQNEVTIKKIAYETYKTTLTSVINQVIYNVKNDYYNLLLAIEKERVAEDTVKKYDLFYRQAKAFYEIGTNPKIDVTIAQVNLSDAKLSLISAKNNVDSAIATLNDAMGVPELGKYKVKDRLRYSPVKINFEDAVEIAKQSRPDLKLAELQVKQASQEVKLAKKAYFPTLEAEAGYKRGGYQWNGSDGYNYGLYLNFPVVNGLLIANQISEAKALYNREIAEAQQTRNEIHLEIHEAYLMLDVKQHQIPVSALQVKQAKENYDLSFGRYRVGVGNPIELKDAQNAYQTAQLNYYQTLYDYNSAKAALEKAIGRNIIGGEQDHINLQMENPIKTQIENNKKAVPKEVKKPIKIGLPKSKLKPNKTAAPVKKDDIKPLVPIPANKVNGAAVKKPTPAVRKVTKKPTTASKTVAKSTTVKVSSKTPAKVVKKTTKPKVNVPKISG